MMNSWPKPLISSIVIACLALIVPSHALSDEHILDVSKIDFEPSFRIEGEPWNDNIAAARTILDEMRTKQGEDNTLDAFNWDDYEFSVAVAAHYIKIQKRSAFKGVIDRINIEDSSPRRRLQKREKVVRLLHDTMSNELTSEIEVFAQLAGDRPEKNRSALQQLSEKIQSMLVGAAGKAASSLWDYAFELREDEAKMDLVHDKMLEKLELVAYLDVLLAKYHHTIGVLEQIVRDLEEAYDTNQRACAEAKSAAAASDAAR